MAKGDSHVRIRCLLRSHRDRSLQKGEQAPPPQNGNLTEAPRPPDGPQGRGAWPRKPPHERRPTQPSPPGREGDLLTAIGAGAYADIPALVINRRTEEQQDPLTPHSTA